jgi:hypothetical protein
MLRLLRSLQIDESEIPVLDIGDREGSTGYIDFITPEDMKADLMQGIDQNGRTFLAVKMQYKQIQPIPINTEDEEFTRNRVEKTNVVVTIFERYLDRPAVLASGTAYYPNYFSFDSRIRSDAHLELIAQRINQLFRGETVQGIAYLDGFSYSCPLEPKFAPGVSLEMPDKREKVKQLMNNIVCKDIAGLVMEYF